MIHQAKPLDMDEHPQASSRQQPSAQARQVSMESQRVQWSEQGRQGPPVLARQQPSLQMSQPMVLRHWKQLEGQLTQYPLMKRASQTKQQLLRQPLQLLPLLQDEQPVGQTVQLLPLDRQNPVEQTAQLEPLEHCWQLEGQPRQLRVWLRQNPPEQQLHCWLLAQEEQLVLHGRQACLLAERQQPLLQRVQRLEDRQAVQLGLMVEQATQVPSERQQPGQQSEQQKVTLQVMQPWGQERQIPLEMVSPGRHRRQMFKDWQQAQSAEHQTQLPALRAQPGKHMVHWVCPLAMGVQLQQLELLHWRQVCMTRRGLLVQPGQDPQAHWLQSTLLVRGLSMQLLHPKQQSLQLPLGPTYWPLGQLVQVLALEQVMQLMLQGRQLPLERKQPALQAEQAPLMQLRQLGWQGRHWPLLQQVPMVQPSQWVALGLQRQLGEAATHWPWGVVMKPGKQKVQAVWLVHWAQKAGQGRHWLSCRKQLTLQRLQVSLRVTGLMVQFQQLVTKAPQETHCPERRIQPGVQMAHWVEETHSMQLVWMQLTHLVAPQTGDTQKLNTQEEQVVGPAQVWHPSTHTTHILQVELKNMPGQEQFWQLSGPVHRLHSRGQAEHTPVFVLRQNPEAQFTQVVAVELVAVQLAQFEGHGTHLLLLRVAPEKQAVQLEGVEEQLRQGEEQGWQTPFCRQVWVGQLVQKVGELQVRQVSGQNQQRLRVVFKQVPSMQFWQTPPEHWMQAKEMEAQGSVGMQRLNSRVKPVSQALQVIPRQEEQWAEQQLVGSVHFSQTQGEAGHDAQLLTQQGMLMLPTMGLLLADGWFSVPTSSAWQRARRIARKRQLFMVNFPNNDIMCIKSYPLALPSYRYMPQSQYIHVVASGQAHPWPPLLQELHLPPREREGAAGHQLKPLVRTPQEETAVLRHQVLPDQNARPRPPAIAVPRPPPPPPPAIHSRQNCPREWLL